MARVSLHYSLPWEAQGLMRYTQILSHHQLPFTTDAIWAHAQDRQKLPTQGWKLHLSVVLTEAEDLLHTILPYVKAQRVAFKVAKDSHVLSQINAGHHGNSQIGKFLTVYPATDELSVRLARKLAALTERFKGPEVVTDLKLGAVVYSRYGGYQPIVKRSPLGAIEKYIHHNATGELIKDEYTAPYQPKNHPFGNLLAQREDPWDVHERVQAHYRVLSQLKSSPKGDTFMGVNIETRRPVVIKTGRPHHLVDLHGREMLDRIVHEGSLLKHLAGIPGVPKCETVIHTHRFAVVVKEYVPGRALKDQPKSRFAQLTAPQRALALTVTICLIELVQAIHRKGVIHRDITPGNVVVTDHHLPHLIDFELSHEMDHDEPPYSLGTVGFMSPQQEQVLRPTVMDDVFSLAVLIVSQAAAIGVRHVHHLRVMGKSSFTRRLARLTGLPGLVLEPLAHSMDDRPEHRPSVDELLQSFRDVA